MNMLDKHLAAATQKLLRMQIYLKAFQHLLYLSLFQFKLISLISIYV